MPTLTCAHCNVPLEDRATMVERAGQTFCCNNCAAATTGHSTSGQPATSSCAHCKVQIIDESTMVERGGQTFCCGNCAAAMKAGAAHGQH